VKKIIIITGASKGLGLEMCKQALNEDYKVIAISRKETQDIRLLKKEYSNDLYFESFDLMDLDGIYDFTVKIIKEYGKPWALINNAAIGIDGILATMHHNDINNIIKVNLEAPILLTKYFLRPMLLNKSGRVINISSIIANTGFNGLSVYGATKAGLIGFSKSLSREVGKLNITVNSILPGYMETDMTMGMDEKKLKSIKRRSPMRKLVKVSDVVNAILFLLSDSASSITGTTITIDAGSTA